LMQDTQIKKLEKMKIRYKELNKLLSQPEVLDNMKLLQKYSKEQKELEEIVSLWQQYDSLRKEMDKMEEIVKEEEDEEIKELAREEKKAILSQMQEIEEKIFSRFSISDKFSQRNAIMEIRAGVGGEEAALFVADLYKMYVRFGEGKGWKIENIHSHPTDMGGLKEIIFAVEGKDAFFTLCYEKGVHRVQRIPATESSGRIHTSTVTVAVFPEAEDVEVDINSEDLRIDTFHSRGAGGQHVNVTDSAVRITHIPTGIVTQCQDERSQHQNRIKAMRILRSKLLQKIEEEQKNKISQQRKAQIGRGERSERIRTYNFPQGRVTDHRVHLTLYNLEEILNGGMDRLLNPLRKKLKGEKIVSGFT